jgi:uncharacterized damage-inducible protein DinB
MNLTSAILESWDRQASIVKAVAEKLEPDQLTIRISESEMTIGEHLCHIHQTRTYWLNMLNPDFDLDMGGLYDEDWNAIIDSSKIKLALAKSSKNIHLAVDPLLVDDAGPVGPYRHPIHFVQHMIWHEGWHVGAILLALRMNGQALSEEWEDPNIWGVWRTYG